MVLSNFETFNLYVVQPIYACSFMRGWEQRRHLLITLFDEEKPGEKVLRVLLLLATTTTTSGRDYPSEMKIIEMCPMLRVLNVELWRLSN